MHHLSVDRKYVYDYHGDGVGGHPDKKYYGLDNVNYLAEKKRNWAMRNNDTYLYFTRGVGWAEPLFSGSWGRRSRARARSTTTCPGTGWSRAGVTWPVRGSTSPTSRRTCERAADATQRSGAPGPGGNGDLFDATLNAFASHWQSVKAKQDLIDIEIYKSGSSWRYLGVYRQKVGAATPPGLDASGSPGTTSSKTGRRRGRRGTSPMSRPTSFPAASTTLRCSVREVATGRARVRLVEAVLGLQDLAEREGATHRRRALDRGREMAVPRGLAGNKRVGAAPYWLLDRRLRRQMERLGSQKTLVDLEEHSALPLRVP